MSKSPPRFLVVTYPVQGHINPVLQFSKRLLAAAPDAHVTFVTTLSAHRRMSAEASSAGGGRITHAPFYEGYDDGYKPGDDVALYLSSMSQCGSRAISDLVVAAAAEGRPYTCLVYSLLLPWAGRTADDLGLPSFVLWIQPATVFVIYYYYFHGYEAALSSTATAAAKATLPGLSLQLSPRDVPSFMDAGNTYSFAIPLFRAQFEILNERPNVKVLVNTFEELESEALRAIAGDAVKLIPVGPLIPSAFLGGRDPSDTSFGGDLFQRSKDDRVVEWLNSQPKSSVIYVSFGSISVLSRDQKEEIAKALLDCGRPFLWVIRDDPIKGKEEEKSSGELSRREELEKLGLVVPWCRQVEVLSNEALGCFVTHCGWNSTVESLASGVAVVAVPQWTDQGTNAKLVSDVWRVGVRAELREDGVVESGELKRCLEMVMEGEEFRENARKWRGLAREAAGEGGSSDVNLKAFVAEVIGEASS